MSVTTTEYWPRSSLSGLVKVSLELRTKAQTLETRLSGHLLPEGP